MSTNNIDLTDTWVEASAIDVLIVLIDGSEFWVNLGATLPTNDDNYFPINADTLFFLHKDATEKTFIRKARGTIGNTMRVSIVELP